MMKRLACIALLFAVFVATQGGHGRGHGGSGQGQGGFGQGQGGFGQGQGGFGQGQGGFGQGQGGFGHGNGGSGHGHGGHGAGGWLAALLCPNGTLTNATLASEYLSQVQQFFSDLASNGSFGVVLAAEAQLITYLNNNGGLLTSNCTAFFSGLRSAKQADQAATLAQQQAAIQGYAQIIKSLFEGNYQNDD